MAKYRDLIAWRKAHELALSVYKATQDFPSEERFGLTQQLRRAALSVPANIAEGYGRKSKKEIMNFLTIALGSQAETMYLIEFSADMKYLSRSTAERLTALADEVGRLTWSLRQSIA